MPVGTVDTTFADVTAWLSGHAGTQASALLLNGDGLWWTALVSGTPVEPFDISGIADAFTRAGANEVYARALNDPVGTLADCAAMTMQGDYLSANERAYRLRYASKIRRQAHTAARSKGHGNAALGVFGRVTQHVTEVIAQGDVDFVPPSEYEADYFVTLAEQQNLAMGRG